MDEHFSFLNYDGLDDGLANQLRDWLHPSNLGSEIEFPWSDYAEDPETNRMKGALSSLNVHAPAFEAFHRDTVLEALKRDCQTQDSSVPPFPRQTTTTLPTTSKVTSNSSSSRDVTHNVPVKSKDSVNSHPFSNGPFTKPSNGSKSPPVSTFKLNPTVSCFVPQSYVAPSPAGTENSYSTLETSSSSGKAEINISSVKSETNISSIKSETNISSIKSETNVSSVKAEINISTVKTETSISSGNVGTNITSGKAGSNITSVSSVKLESIVSPPKTETSSSYGKPDCSGKLEANISSGKLEASISSGKLETNISSGKLEANISSGKLEANISSGKLETNISSGKLETNMSSAKPQTNTISGKPENKLKKVVSIEVKSEKQNGPIMQNGFKEDVSVPVKNKPTASVVVDISDVKPARKSWAEIASSGQKPTEKSPKGKPIVEVGSESLKETKQSTESVSSSVDEDKMALSLGDHLHQHHLDFNPIFLQPRGLINRRNWCYINATLQALLACPPFYMLVRNLPLGPAVDRGKSSTPVIDSMVKMTYEFLQLDASQEELQTGAPFQPDFIYEMLKDLKSDCLKGQQEDAEEFLSFILNGMHEEMVKIIKNYEKKHNLKVENEVKENGDISEGEEEWQVIGSKHKGMVTRKVAEHKTPVSDLLGGQIKSFLTTSGSKTSASIQPFFTLQLDIQSENVTSVPEALKVMTMKEPIHGYTCAKTKQEVEAYSHLSLQKLPPILILHLKRFVYNKTGGCKKVMKKTDYPLELELGKEMFSPEVKKAHRQRRYKLFAVMYHDGEEAVKGHYISDVYNHGCQSWLRCDDRTISAVTEEQVLSHSPPRVPYLLFYQES